MARRGQSVGRSREAVGRSREPVGRSRGNSGERVRLLKSTWVCWSGVQTSVEIFSIGFCVQNQPFCMCIGLLPLWAHVLSPVGRELPRTKLM